MNRSHFPLRRLPLIAALLTVISVAIASCTGSSPADAALQRAEQLIDSVPAEGMAALDSIPADHLTTQRSRALYDLLHTRAAHRLHLNPAADSAMDASVSYFEQAGSGELHHLKMACFYSAVAHYYAGNYPAALRRALRCIDVATDLSDNYYLAKAHELIADIYYDSFNDYSYACDELNIAADYYEKAGFPLNALYAKRDIGLNNYVLKRYERALAIFDSLISVTDTASSLHKYLIGDRLRLKITTGDIEGCEHDLTIFNNAGLYRFNYEGAFLNANYALARGNYDKAASIIDTIRTDKVNNIERIMLMRIEILKHEGRFEEALEISQELGALDDSVTKASHVLNPTKIIKEHNIMNSELELSRLHNKNLLIIIGLSLLIIVLIVILICLYNRHRKKEMEREALLHDMYVNKNIIDEAHNTIKTEYFQMLKERFSQIDLLCISYFDNADNKTSGKRFRLEVDNLIESMTDRHSIELLERHLNNSYKGIVERLRQQLSGWNEQDILFIIYMIAGFSAKTISLFTGRNISSFYVRKKRIILKLESSSPRDLDEYLSFIR